jgi:peptidoglycan hydrolase CwlO-like protein
VEVAKAMREEFQEKFKHQQHDIEMLKKEIRELKKLIQNWK